ncbi:MAG: DEAD/DEAH box helicase [Methanomicrobiales archaeon]|nr:DEAD/DEAH box helicase [Methanomicrobiales archaeon]
MKFITHSLIRCEALEEREYQLAIAMRALDGNTMVVLPTGLGKTAIALLVVASRLKNEGGKVLVLAPTKPLVEQHLRFFTQFLVPGEAPAVNTPSMVMFTGETPIEDRTAGWVEAQVIFATPQVIKNDVIAGRYGLEEVSLLIVDECHRAVGNYAYVYLARRYLTTARRPLILAMTASPGGDRARVDEVCHNLGIEIVETRVESDPDVRPYIHERDLQFITIDLPDSLGQALDVLQRLVEIRLQALAKLHFTVPKRQHLTMKALNGIQMQIQERIRNRDRSAYGAASIHAEIMKIRHAIALVESQGSEALKRYLEKLAHEGNAPGGSKASVRLARDPQFRHLYLASKEWQEERHPKLGIAISLIKAQLVSSPESRSIIFASYRDTVQLLSDALRAEGIPAERFIGQATRDADRGFSQKKQLEILNRFRAGELKVLIATSVGEEGLDVPSTDLVIFYEAVPSEIRSIQRKGRTGRTGRGRIIVLVTKGTSDEAYRYVSQTKERAMLSEIRSMGDRPAPAEPAVTGQMKISAFLQDGPAITVDDRESSSQVVEVLSELGARITLQRLEQGDYAIGDRILVERKTTVDFMNTLVDRNLFGQLTMLAAAAPRPVMIIEGGDLFTIRDIHPNAVRGTLAAIAVDMGIPVLFTKDAGETAHMLLVLARRAADQPQEGKLHPHKSYRSLKEQQEYLIASLPGVGLKHARLLLEHFGTIRDLINAEREDLVSIHGIGEKTAEGIWELLRHPYG